MNSFKKLSITAKMILVFGFIVTLSIGMIVFSVYEADRIGAAGTDAATVSAPRMDAMMEMKIQAMDAFVEFTDLYDGVGYGSLDKMNASFDKIDWYLKVMLNGSSEKGAVYEKVTDPEIVAKLKQYRSQLAKFRSTCEDILNNTAARKKTDMDTFREAFSNFKESFSDVEDRFEKDLDASVRKIDNLNSTNKRSMGILIVIGVLIVTLFGVLFIRMLTRPILDLKKGMDSVGNGDYTVFVKTDLKDELGDLVNWFNDFVDKLKKMRDQEDLVRKNVQSGTENLNTMAQALREIAEALNGKAGSITEQANSTAAATEQMSSNLTSVSSAAEQSQVNLNTVASATEEMTSTIGEIAGNAEQARSITTDAQKSVENAATKVDELGHAAREVSKVTETIMDIAEQTKLLALNATIEAARAGEAGKGFAVVANEVKELAKQTNDATEDISRKIAAIQNSTDATVHEMKNINEVVARVTEIVTTIATAVEEQNVTTQDIATNISQATAGVREVVENVIQVATVSREVASSMVQVNNELNDVNATSARLNDNVAVLTETSSQLKSVADQFN